MLCVLHGVTPRRRAQRLPCFKGQGTRKVLGRRTDACSWWSSIGSAGQSAFSAPCGRMRAHAHACVRPQRHVKQIETPQAELRTFARSETARARVCASARLDDATGACSCACVACVSMAAACKCISCSR
jgi:hypothetical protein